jgi:hypothetical protein
MPARFKSIFLLSAACAWLGAAPAPAPIQSQGGWDPCGAVKDPASLWRCWSAGAAGAEGVRAAACVPKTACPPLDERQKPVLNCWYERGFRTGFRCILFCNYGDTNPWGSDGSGNCN